MSPRRLACALVLLAAAAAGQTASRAASGQDESRPGAAAREGPSSRFSREELDYARGVAAGPRGLDREALSLAAGRLQPDPLSAGWAELAVRFDWPSARGGLLARPGDEIAMNAVRAMGAPPKRCLEVLGPEMTIRFAATGAESAIEDLVHHEWTADSVRMLWDWGGPLRRLADPRVVRIHVNALLAARRGFRVECDLGSYDLVATITNWLRERPRAEQDAALGWLDGAPPFLEDRRWSQLLQVRAALGDPPAPKLLATLEYTGFTETCELSLEPWADRYAEVLPAFRADPRKYWFQLVLLRDASAVGELGRWLDEVVVDPKKRDILGAVTMGLRLIGGKAAVEALYRAAKPAVRSGNPRVAGVVLHAIVRLESPEQWKRVAALAEPAPDRFHLVPLAAVGVLAKKP